MFCMSEREIVLLVKKPTLPQVFVISARKTLPQAQAAVSQYNLQRQIYGALPLPSIERELPQCLCSSVELTQTPASPQILNSRGIFLTHISHHCGSLWLWFVKASTRRNHAFYFFVLNLLDDFPSVNTSSSAKWQVRKTSAKCHLNKLPLNSAN